MACFGSYSTCSVGHCHLKDEINEVNQRKDHLEQKFHSLSDKRFEKADQRFQEAVRFAMLDRYAWSCFSADLSPEVILNITEG